MTGTQRLKVQVRYFGGWCTLRHNGVRGIWQPAIPSFPHNSITVAMSFPSNIGIVTLTSASVGTSPGVSLADPSLISAFVTNPLWSWSAVRKSAAESVCLGGSITSMEKGKLK